MELVELLGELRGSGVYSDREWEDYFSCFSEDVCRAFAARSLDLKHEIVRRIRCGEHGPTERPDPSISPKIVTADHFIAEKDISGIRLGVVSGSYDLFHRGHARVMRYAKGVLSRQPNAKLCALTLSDEIIRANKGPGRPVLNVNERLRIIAGIRYVDYVILLEGPNCISTLQRLPVSLFFKTKTDMEMEIVGKEVAAAESQGGSLHLFPESVPRVISTTEIINRIRSHPETVRPGNRGQAAR
jgi:glycerol-3-phosphate cytidylyltransferase-like family protein